MNSQQNATNAALSPIQWRLPALDTDPLPAVVYHYTNSAGLLGIISSGSLWATDYRFLNDSSEIAYIFRLAADVVREEYAGKHSGLAGAFIDYAASTSAPYSHVSYYLCCFSELDNSLGQWRAYGGKQGYSLAFPGDITNHGGVDPGKRQNPGITLLRVNYSQQDQKKYIRTLLNELITLCGWSHMISYGSYQSAIAAFSPFYWGQLERASYRFKHPDFEAEKEWRLVAWGDVHAENFRAASVITPFTQFRLFSTSAMLIGSGLPLTAVRSGPSELPEATAISLDKLLNRYGYAKDRCQRLGSDTPVRL